MKKVLLVLFIIMFLATAASADSLSTSKTIRLYVRVVASEGIEAGGGVVEMASFEESEALEPSSNPARKTDKNPNINPFSKLGDAFMSLFSPAAGTSKGMIRKY